MQDRHASGHGSNLICLLAIRMTRFKIKDIVEINSVITSKRTGQQGQIKKVIADKQRIQTLDRYVVDFDKQEEDTFWDIQLVLVSPPAHRTGEDDKESA